MCFHRFLHREGVDIRDLDRATCVKWIRFLFEKKKYSASTRLQRLVNTRGYLYWLSQQGIVKANIDELIKTSDFPKIDLVLPKPLPPHVDAEIQRRLVASSNVYHMGALLLRATGMRLGELSSLSFNPIWRDASPRNATNNTSSCAWIAQLGGFLARKGNGEPGIVTIWRGWQRLTDIAEDWLLFNSKTCG